MNFVHKKNYYSIIMLFFLLLFYIFFAIFDGYIICVDSQSYLIMSFSREPIYPIILWLFRTLFQPICGEKYLFFVVLFQSLLAAYCAWSLGEYLRKRFNLTYLFSTVIYLIPALVSLLNRFAAKRASMYSNSILTEGITISLYMLCFRYLLEYAYEHSKKSFITICILLFVLISTRKQMICLLPVFLLLILFRFMFLRKMLRGLLQVIITCLTLFVFIAGLDCSYNLILRGELTGHGNDNRFISTMIFYATERNSADYIQDEEIRNLYLSIYDVCDAKQCLYHSADKGWLNEVNHFGNSYDQIQIDTMWPMIIEHVATTHPELNPTEQDLETDRINTIIIKSILPHILPQITHLFFNNFISGLVTTIAQRNSILIIYSLFAYIVYLIIFVYQIYNLVHKKKGNLSLTKDSLIVSSLCLISIISNVSLVSAVIFCQTRYTIYNMSLFYISALILLFVTKGNVKLK